MTKQEMIQKATTIQLATLPRYEQALKELKREWLKETDNNEKLGMDGSWYVDTYLMRKIQDFQTEVDQLKADVYNLLNLAGVELTQDAIKDYKDYCHNKQVATKN